MPASRRLGCKGNTGGLLLVGDGEEEKVGIFNELEFAGFVCDK